MRRSGAAALVLGLCLMPFFAVAACGSEFQGDGDDAEAGSGGGAGDITGAGGSKATGGTAQGGADPGGADQGGTTSTGGTDQGGTTSTSGTNQGGTSSTGGMAGAGATGGIAGAIATGGVAGALGGRGGGGGIAGAGGGLSTDRLVYWFSADVGVSVTSGGVSRWGDRSMNQADAVQLSSATRPTLGTLGDSTLPAIAFDGTDDYLGLPPLTARFAQGVSFFAVARATDAPVCMSLLQLSNGSEIDDISVDSQDGSLVYEVYNDWLVGQDGAFGVGDVRLVEAVQASNGSVSLWLNGVSTGIGSFELPADVDRNQTFVGRSLYANCPNFSGEISEIVLYARSVATDERTSIEAYLADKWQCCGS